MAYYRAKTCKNVYIIAGNPKETSGEGGMKIVQVNHFTAQR